MSPLLVTASACLCACAGGIQAQEPQRPLDNAAHDLCVDEHKTAGYHFGPHDLGGAEHYIMQVPHSAASSCHPDIV